MRDTVLSWALVNAVFALLFYAISAFVFWQIQPGQWPVEGRATLAVLDLLFIGYTSLVVVRNLNAE